jgi:1-acyl-sn-glycerol-3-phosphate acyltransferase
VDLPDILPLSGIETYPFPQPKRPTAWYRVGQVTVNILKHLLYQWDVAYHAPMPFGAKLLVSNHPTTVDPILMTALVPEQMSILITEVLFKVPVVGASLRKCQHIRVDRGAGRAALEQGVQMLAAGGTLGIYPEGIVSPAEGGLAHFHSGAARLALESGAVVVPVGVAVQREKIWRKNSTIDGQVEPSSWYTGGIYALTIGQPLTFRGSGEDRERVRQVTAELAEQIFDLSLESAHRLALARKHRPIFIVRWLRPVFAR